ncbi:MAG TPA: Trm112 family protein [Candidatus Aminicenantes bacterium]|nr:Trm112 family protein [Candidatus Aminicenantes bacterium]
MPISPALLAILACPACKGDIKLTADETGLKCVACQRVYPVRGDIPVMIVDEAAVEPDRPVKP